MKERFESFLDRVRFKRNNVEVSLAAVLPWGTVDENGEFRFDDKYQNSGEPAVALGLRSFNVSELARKSPDYSKVIVLADPEKFTQNLANFGSVLDRQKVIMFAEKRHSSEFPVLLENGFRIWNLSHEEICCGLKNSDEELAVKAFKTVRRSVEAQSQIVSLVAVESNEFDESALLLERLRRTLKSLDESLESVEGLLQRLYFLLLDLASLLDASAEILEDMDHRLAACTDDVARLGLFLEENLKTNFIACIESLEKVVHGMRTTGETAKSRKLIELLRDLPDRNGAIVIPRTKYGRNDISSFLSRHGLFPSVGDSSESLYDRSFSAAFLTGWPNGRRWLKFVNSGISQRMFLLAYSFESKWYACEFSR